MAFFPLECVINRNNLPRLHFLTYLAAACIKACRVYVLNGCVGGVSARRLQGDYKLLTVVALRIFRHGDFRRGGSGR